MAVEPTSSTFSTSTNSAAHHSPWHSPVPYLFGGLAAMLALIAFALLVLAYSYFKLYRTMNNDLESGNNNREDKQEHYKAPIVFEDNKYLVIMAGQAKPTFLATPISSSTVTNLFDVGNISKEKVSTTEVGDDGGETWKP
uniref:protein GLUTAMINE DUMPER 2-like n=1 Tax=Erigeron canadensis TaxID=72917 RepID=UPI001CB93C97|nr:protein GLUTAMINE DUMPER 2-like [Erigeron canadensis]